VCYEAIRTSKSAQLVLWPYVLVGVRKKIWGLGRSFVWLSTEILEYFKAIWTIMYLWTPLLAYFLLISSTYHFDFVSFVTPKILNCWKYGTPLTVSLANFQDDQWNRLAYTPRLVRDYFENLHKLRITRNKENFKCIPTVYYFRGHLILLACFSTVFIGTEVSLSPIK
jgi:hypothetical protein